jgi:hypothetical protein
MAAIPAEVAAELTRLRAENARLLRLLKLTPQQAAPPGLRRRRISRHRRGPVHDGSPPDAKVAFFGALFAARTDVYAVRFDNPRTGKQGWLPAIVAICRFPRCPDIVGTAPGRPRIAGVAVRSLSCGSAWSA